MEGEGEKGKGKRGDEETSVVSFCECYGLSFMVSRSGFTLAFPAWPPPGIDKDVYHRRFHRPSYPCKIAKETPLWMPSFPLSPFPFPPTNFPLQNR